MASKHRSVHVPSFDNYSPRENEKARKKAADRAQVAIVANKEYTLRALTLGNHEFDAQTSRAYRAKVAEASTEDKDVGSPNFYTHHDNAIAMMNELKGVHKRRHLSPNLRFENSQGRDGMLYKLSDLSNLEHDSYFRKKNPIDRFLEIQGLLPHKNTLADGYAKSTTYEKPVLASMKSRNSRALTERKGGAISD